MDVRKNFHWRPGGSAVEFPKEGKMKNRKKIAGVGAIVLALTAFTGAAQLAHASPSVTTGPNCEAATACAKVSLTSAQAKSV